MMIRIQHWRAVGAALSAALVLGCAASGAFAQDGATTRATETRTRLDTHADAADVDPTFDYMLRRFAESYRLGPGDEIAVRVVREPDYSIDRVRISPFGAVYHPLLGDVKVAGMTAGQAAAKLESELAEYILKPRVSVALLDARSAKLGVIGDVADPGIIVMAQPMTVLDAISAAGGFTNFGNSTDVTVLRQLGSGQTRTFEVNVKRILEGKSKPNENVALQPGDTVVVHGNKKKTLATITSLAGFGSFLTFLGGR